MNQTVLVPQVITARVADTCNVVGVDGAIALPSDVIEVEEGVNVNPQPHQSAYRSIPEARDLTWEDSFYDGDISVVAVFDYDEEKCAIFHRRAKWTINDLWFCSTILWWAGSVQLRCW